MPTSVIIGNDLTAINDCVIDFKQKYLSFGNTEIKFTSERVEEGDIDKELISNLGNTTTDDAVSFNEIISMYKKMNNKFGCMKVKPVTLDFNLSGQSNKLEYTLYIINI